MLDEWRARGGLVWPGMERKAPRTCPNGRAHRCRACLGAVPVLPPRSGSYARAMLFRLCCYGQGASSHRLGDDQCSLRGIRPAHARTAKAYGSALYSAPPRPPTSPASLGPKPATSNSASSALQSVNPCRPPPNCGTLHNTHRAFTPRNNVTARQLSLLFYCLLHSPVWGT